MRRIVRQEAPPNFWEKGKAKLHVRSYDDLSDTNAGMELRCQLRQHLIQTQSGLCAYCCKKINMENSLNEHIQPKSLYPRLSLDYGNLIASCAEKTTCGMKKDNNYDERFVSPLDEACERQFAFATDGSIYGLTPDGEYTCELLNLNSLELRRARKAVLQNCRSFGNKELVRRYYLNDEDGGLRAYADIIIAYCQGYDLD